MCSRRERETRDFSVSRVKIMEPDHSQNPRASERMILLYLKALIWSVFVAYGERTVAAIINCLTCGEVDENEKNTMLTHISDALRNIINLNKIKENDWRIA